MTRKTIFSLLVLFSILILGTGLAAGADWTPAEPAGAPTAGIYRGVSPVVNFDVSPPLRDLAAAAAKLDVDYVEIPERDSGLEGPLGPQDTDPLVQSLVGPNLIPEPLVSFDGPSNLAGVSPPDPVGDVGPDHYVAMSNLYSAIYAKDGTELVAPFPNNTFWAGFGGDCQTDNSGDPVVLHDQMADRWLVTQFTSSGPTYFNCVALSTGPDPTGTYYRYAVGTGANFPDYPKYGVWPDAYYISTREFNGPFVGVGAYAMNRAQMLVGDPNPDIVSFLVPPGAEPYNVGDGLLPSDMDGSILPPAGSPNYYMGSMDDGGQYGAPQDALTLWKFAVDFDVPANSSFTLEHTIPVAAFDSQFPCAGRSCIPQPDTSNRLDILSYRQRPIWRLAYRNFGDHESLVTNQSVEAAPNIAGNRWYEIRDPDGTPFIYQQGTYAPGVSDGIHRWMGSIAMDGAGNMALGYSASDATSTYPSVWYTGRLASDPLGTMPQGEASIIDGTGSQTSSQRWGDYTSMNIDPVDDCTFWYVNEYVPVTSPVGWQLRIGAFRFDECGAPDFYVSAEPATQNICVGSSADYDILVGSISGYSDPVTLSTLGEPAGATTIFMPNPVTPPDNSVLTVDEDGSSPAGSYDIDVVGVAASSSHTATVELVLYDEVPGTLDLVSPADGATNVPLAPTFSWTAASGALTYDLEVATDPAFTNIIASFTGIEETSFTPDADLPAGATLYWRVRAQNPCGSGSESSVFSFSSDVCVAPALNIPDNDPVGITYDMVFLDGAMITDLNVALEVAHPWVGNLLFELEHVDTGTSVTFIDQPGYPASLVGCTGDDIDAVIDDEAALPVEDECDAGIPTINGSFFGGDPPDSSLLAAFDGESLAGTWRLTAADLVGGNTGTVNSWCVQTETVSYGVDLPEDTSGEATPGTAVTYELEVMNSGEVTDTIDLMVSGNSWTTALSTTSVNLAPGESAMFMVTVLVPGGVMSGTADMVTVTATSGGDPGTSDSLEITTTAGQHLMYLPILLNIP